MVRGRRMSPRDARVAIAGAGRYNVLRQYRAGRDTRGKCLNTSDCKHFSMTGIA